MHYASAEALCHALREWSAAEQRIGGGKNRHEQQPAPYAGDAAAQRNGDQHPQGGKGTRLPMTLG